MALAEQYTPDPSLPPTIYEEFLRLNEKLERVTAQLDGLLANGPAGELQVSTERVPYTLVADGPSGAAITSYTSSAAYYRCGKIIFVSGAVNIVTAGAANGEYLRVSLPFPAGADLAVGVGQDLAVNGWTSTATLLPGQTTAVFRLYNNGGIILNGLGFYFSLSYTAA
jgi:hypothetical protein